MINKKDIENIIENAVMDYIVEKVIEKMQSYNKSALVLFTGASIGFSQSIKELRSLKGKGWKLKVVMSKSAEEVLGINLIKDLLSLEEVITENSNSDLNKLINDFNFIIIPSLTINTASKIANCINDNLVTNIISNSMISGKPVITSINACCPDNIERNSMGFFVTEPYKNKLRNNLEILKSYGINLTTSENLSEKANQVFLKSYGKLKLNKDQDYKNKKIIKIDEKLISRSCILNNSNFSIIKVDKNAVITDLAKDEAVKFNIKIIKE